MKSKEGTLSKGTHRYGFFLDKVWPRGLIGLGINPGRVTVLYS